MDIVLSDTISFSRACRYNEMSDILMNLFKHISTPLFGRLSSVLSIHTL